MTRRAAALTSTPQISIRGEIDRLAGFRQSLLPAIEQHRQNVFGNPARQRAELGSATALQLAQSNPRSRNFGLGLAGAISAMKNRQKVVNQGEKAINQQNLRDRLKMVQGDLARSAGLTKSLQNVANIKEGVNVGVSDARQFAAESNANLFGTVVGAGTRALTDPDSRAKIFDIFGIGGSTTTPQGQGDPADLLVNGRRT